MKSFKIQVFSLFLVASQSLLISFFFFFFFFVAIVTTLHIPPKMWLRTIIFLIIIYLLQFTLTMTWLKLHHRNLFNMKQIIWLLNIFYFRKSNWHLIYGQRHLSTKSVVINVSYDFDRDVNKIIISFSSSILISTIIIELYTY